MKVVKSAPLYERLDVPKDKLIPIFIPSSNIVRKMGDGSVGLSLGYLVDHPDGDIELDPTYPTLTINCVKDVKTTQSDDKTKPAITTVTPVFWASFLKKEFGLHRVLDEDGSLIAENPIVRTSRVVCDVPTKTIYTKSNTTEIYGFYNYLYTTDMDDWEGLIRLHAPDAIMIGSNQTKEDLKDVEVKGQPTKEQNCTWKWPCTLNSNFIGHLRNDGLLVDGEFACKEMAHMYNDFRLLKDGGSEDQESLLSYRTPDKEPSKLIRNEAFKRNEDNPLNRDPNSPIKNLKESHAIREFVMRSECEVRVLLTYRGTTFNKSYIGELKKKIIGDYSVLDIQRMSRPNSGVSLGVATFFSKLLVRCIYLSDIEENRYNQFKETYDERLERCYKNAEAATIADAKNLLGDNLQGVSTNLKELKSKFYNTLKNFSFTSFVFKVTSPLKREVVEQPMSSSSSSEEQLVKKVKTEHTQGG